MTYAMRLFFLFLSSELVATIPGYNKNNISTYVKLRNDILSRDAVVHRISPLFASPTQTLYVSYSLVLVDILDIDQVKQVKWTQEYLSWDPGLYDNMTEVNIETRSLWVPDIVILVGYDESLSLELPEWAIVDWTGSVTCDIRQYISFRCAIDFKKYPFDTQECKLGFVPFVDIAGKVVIEYNITESTIKPDPYVTAGEWQLTGYHWKLSEDINLRTYPVYFIKVRRLPGYYVITIIFPLILTSAMITLVFLIPTKTGEKISFFVTLYTSLSIFLNLLSTVMPRNLSSAPYLIRLLVGVLMQGLLANLATLFVVNRYEKEKDKKTNSSFKRIFRKRSDKIEPVEDTVDKKPKDLRNDIPSGLESTEAIPIMMSSTPFRISSSQWDKAFFFLFSFVEVILLGTLFGATDWLTDASPLGF